MLSLTFNGGFRLKEGPVPAPGPGEVLVRVALAGVCRTDLEVLRGYHAFRGTPGHEFVGVAAGPPDTPWLGRRVVGEINVPCGTCPRCRRGQGRHCESRQVLGLVGRNGAFAQYLTLPAANLHAVPDHVPDEAAVFTEPLAAALAAKEAAPGLKDAQVLVVGDGVLGLLTSWTMAFSGHRVTLAGHYSEHLRLAEPYGVKGFLESELIEKDFDLVVEASGSPGGLDLALSRVRPQGTVVLKSTYAGRYTLDPESLVVPEVHLTGSRCGPFPEALSLLEESRIDPRPLIARRFSLAAGLEALDFARKPGVLKVLLEMREDD